MDCVLPKYSNNLLINQPFMDSSSELEVASIPTESLPEATKTESSALVINTDFSYSAV